MILTFRIGPTASGSGLCVDRVLLAMIYPEWLNQMSKNSEVSARRGYIWIKIEISSKRHVEKRFGVMYFLTIPYR